MGRYHRTTAAAATLLAAAFAFACSKPNANGGENPAMDTSTVSTAPAPAPADTAAAAKPTDPQIAHIGVTANSIDIDAGKDAKGKATNADVKSFAQEMITDHTAANNEATALVKKLNVTPEDNPTSQSLKSAADSAKQQIDDKKGADFDKAYMDHEVAFHQQVLDALDNTLIPSAQNGELKAFLQKVRGVVQGHLQRAQSIDQKLNGAH
jgi:putative membrane protein